MSTITKIIRTLPIAPDSARPATFETEADAFVSQLPGFGTDTNQVAAQINTVAGEVNTNAAAAQSALNATNLLATGAQQSATDAGNAASAATGAANVNGTSTTSLLPVLGQNNNFVFVEANRVPSLGMRMRAASRAAISTNFALGYVNAWNAATRTVTLAVDVISSGAAAAADWNLMLEGQPGRPGAEAEVLMPALVVSANSVLQNVDNGKQVDCTAAVTLTIGAGIDPGWGVIVNALGFPVTINASFNDATTSRILRPRTSGLLSFNGTNFRLARMGAQLPIAFGIETTSNITAPFGVIGCKATVTGAGSGAMDRGIDAWGGSGGGTAIKTFPITPGQIINCTVGLGGAYAAAGAGTYGGNSTVIAFGSNTIFGSGGQTNPSGQANPGNGGNGDVNLRGGAGDISRPGGSFWVSGGNTNVGLSKGYGAGGCRRGQDGGNEAGADGFIYLEFIMG